MLGKVMASILDFSRKHRATMPTTGMLLRMQGAGASNPSIVSSYNVTSVSRTGAGTYRTTIKQSTAFGVGILSMGIAGADWKITPTGTTDIFEVTADIVSATEVDIKVYALTVSGSKVVRTLYDFVAGDFVHASVFLAAGGSDLPEG